MHFKHIDCYNTVIWVILTFIYLSFLDGTLKVTISLIVKLTVKLLDKQLLLKWQILLK